MSGRGDDRASVAEAHPPPSFDGLRDDWCAALDRIEASVDAADRAAHGWRRATADTGPPGPDGDYPRSSWLV